MPLSRPAAWLALTGLVLLVILRLWASPSTNWPVMFCVFAGALAGLGFGVTGLAFMPRTSTSNPRTDTSPRADLVLLGYLIGVPLILVVTWSKGIGNLLGPLWDTISVSENGIERTSPGLWFSVAFFFGALGSFALADQLSRRR